MKNPLSFLSLDSKTIISIGIVSLLSLFFSRYVFFTFLLILIVSFVLIYKNSEKFKEKFKSILNNALIILISCWLIFFGIEGYLRWLQPKVLQLGVNITGDLSDYTERGYLGKKTFHKSKASFRILGLGDSFARNLTWKKQNYHDLLEQDFIKAGEKNIEIVNAGMECIGPGYYWHILKKYGDSFKPNLVLVGFFIGNDFDEMDFSYASLGRYGIRDYVNPGEKFWRFLRFSDWWLYQFVQKNLIIFRERLTKNNELKQNIVKHEATFSNNIFYDITQRRMWIFEKKEIAHLERNFYNNAEVLLNIKKWCEARNVILVVALFPDQLQVDTNLMKKIIAIYGLSPHSIDLFFPNHLLSKFLEKNQIHYLDMLPEFQQHAKSTALYLINDTHWNQAGNQLAAGLIFSYLRQQRLIPVN
jgi:hypothetical protein